MQTTNLRSGTSGACILGCALLLMGVPALAQQTPDDLDPVSGARLAFPTRADLGDAGKPVANIFARGDEADALVTGPLAFAAYNPAVATALLDLHNGAVTLGSLDARERELAILVACRETNYTLEWNAHERLALDAGVPANVIDVVRNDRELDGVPAADAAVIRFGRELLDDRRMSSSTFADAAQRFGERGAMDLVAVMSTYAVSGLFAIAVDEHPPGQQPLDP